MYAHVVPLLRLPRTLGTFVYAIPDSMSDAQTLIGRRVVVAFRRQKVDGYVLAVSKEKPSHVRTVQPLLSVVEEEYLTDEQRALLERIVSLYAVAPSTAAFAMFPQRPKRPGHAQKSSSLPPPSVTIAPTRLRSIQSIARDAVHKPAGEYFYPFGTIADQVAFLRTVVQDSGHHLVITPSVALAERLSMLLRTVLHATIVVLHSELSVATFWERWLMLHTEKNVVLITTKVGVFSPLHNLASITVVQSTSPHHKQADQNPRYDARNCAEIVRALHATRLFLLDAVPTVAQYAEHTPVTDVVPLPQQRTLVSLTDERTRKNFAPVAEALFPLIARGPTLLFLNQRGVSRTLHCVDCAWTFLCSTCGMPMRATTQNTFACFRCGTTQHAPTTCPHCNGTRLKESGLGTQKLASWAQAQFPSAKVVRVDADAHADCRDADIVVGTAKILEEEQLPRFVTIIVVHLDGMIQLPDFAAQESAYTLLERVFALGNAQTHLFVQTYTTDTTLCTALRTQSWDALYSEEMELRIALRVPPAVAVIKLIGKARSEEDIVKEAHRCVATLRAFPDADAAYTVDDPLTPWYRVQDGWHRRYVLVRPLPGSGATATLQNAVRALDDIWLVDPNPQTLAL